MMGNRLTQHDPSTVGLEMASAREFTHRRMVTSPCDMQELWRDCSALRNGVERLVETLNEVFTDKDCSEKLTNEIKQKLQAVLKFNQAISRKITRNLERHGKMVDGGIQRNEELMFIVKECVSSVNTSVTMLVRNILKMRRLISEMQPSLGLTRLPKENLVFDVISDNQDVDAMLRQLVETESYREDLENYMVNVLACWRDFRSLLLVANDWENSAHEIDNHVKVVADNVAHGLLQLRRYTR